MTLTFDLLTTKWGYGFLSANFQLAMSFHSRLRFRHRTDRRKDRRRPSRLYALSPSPYRGGGITNEVTNKCNQSHYLVHGGEYKIYFFLYYLCCHLCYISCVYIWLTQSSDQTWWTCIFVRRTSRLEHFTRGYPCWTRHYASNVLICTVLFYSANTVSSFLSSSWTFLWRTF